MALALTGTWRAAHLLVLPHALALCDVYTTQRSEGDAHIAQACSVLTPCCEAASALAMAASPATPPRRPPSQSQNAPDGLPRAPLLRTTGAALVAVHGLSASIAQTILAEIGTDMRQGPDEKPLCSWLGLAPKHALSGGKVRKSRTMKQRARAARAFRRAAHAVLRADGALGAFYRRCKGRLGPAQALGATAQKIARTV